MTALRDHGEPRETWDYVILGGGWAGLLAAKEITTRTPAASVLILEADTREESGGLLRTEEIDGFTFDCGGPHILFSRNREVLQEIGNILGENKVVLPRKNFVYFEDQFIPYPFENGIYKLPTEARIRIGTGLLESTVERSKTPNWTPHSFYDWIYGVFGKAMGSEYLEPYNSKIWKRDLRSLSADWVFTPGRVPSPELAEIAKAIAGIESVGYKEQATFIYPRHGGVKSLFDALLQIVEKRGAKVRFGERVRTLHYIGSSWIVNGSIAGRTIISTIPLPLLVSLAGEHVGLSHLMSSFDYNKVLVVGVAMKTDGPDQTAVYVPRIDVPFHRYTWMSSLNPPTAAGSNLIAEVTIPKDAQCNVATLTRAVIEGLKKIGVLKGEDALLFTKSWLNEYGYPIYAHGLASARDAVLSALKQRRIYSVGRWGSWHYWNTDMVLMAVRSTVDEATSGAAGKDA